MDDPAAGLVDWVRAVGRSAGAVVVGHSLGGIVLPLVEARVHVYLCAFVPVPGRPTREVFRTALDPDFGGTERDELGRSYWPDPDVATRSLFREHDPTLARWAFARLRPQAQTAAEEPFPDVSLTAVSAAYVLARADPAVRPDWSREAARAALGVEPLELDGGHFPMLDRPEELADVLERILESLP